ncbi:hypothetical protein BGM25_17385 [Bacillus sp. FJAT-29953]|nr:hypothetical protein [Bacillus sp. FJAT-29953]
MREVQIFCITADEEIHLAYVYSLVTAGEVQAAAGRVPPLMMLMNVVSGMTIA